jgi:hypothetical protein
LIRFFCQELDAFAPAYQEMLGQWLHWYERSGNWKAMEQERLRADGAVEEA